MFVFYVLVYIHQESMFFLVSCFIKSAECQNSKHNAWPVGGGLDNTLYLGGGGVLTQVR